METFLVTFSIDWCEDIEDVYREVCNYLNVLESTSMWRSGEPSTKMISKTSFLISTSLSRNTIRDRIVSLFKSHKTDGIVFVVEVKLSGWSCSCPDKNDDIIKWAKKYISLDE